MFVLLFVVVTLVMIVVIIIICVTLGALTLCCLLLVKLISSLNHCASWCCSGFFQIVMLYKVQRTPWFPLRTLYQALPAYPKVSITYVCFAATPAVFHTDHRFAGFRRVTAVGEPGGL